MDYKPNESRRNDHLKHAHYLNINVFSGHNKIDTLKDTFQSSRLNSITVVKFNFCRSLLLL